MDNGQRSTVIYTFADTFLEKKKLATRQRKSLPSPPGGRLGRTLTAAALDPPFPLLPRRYRRRPASKARPADGGRRALLLPSRGGLWPRRGGIPGRPAWRRRWNAGAAAPGIPVAAVPPRLRGQRGGRPWWLAAANLGSPALIWSPPAAVLGFF